MSIFNLTEQTSCFSFCAKFAIAPYIARLSIAALNFLRESIEMKRSRNIAFYSVPKPFFFLSFFFLAGAPLPPPRQPG